MTDQFVIMQVIPSLEAGGAEQSCVDVNAAIVAAGHRSIVVSSGGAMAARIGNDGGLHIEMDVASKNPATIWRNSYRLESEARLRGVTHFHARSRAPAWSAWLAAREIKLPFVTTFHALYESKNPLKTAYNSVMAKGDRVIATSDTIAAHIADAYPSAKERIITIPRGIDLSRFDPIFITEAQKRDLRQQWNIAFGQQVILFPARLSRIKGHEVFLESLVGLREKGLSQFVAVIIGSDQGRVEYRKELEAIIARENLAANVRLLEHCSDMATAYAISDIAVAPSLVPEGFGRVPVEAQAMGIPVIATDLGATRETVQPGKTGWLIPVNYPGGLRDALWEALRMKPEERRAMGDVGRKHVRLHYDLKQMTAATLSVYARLSPAV